MTIQDNIDTIRGAVSGKDVREAIAQLGEAVRDIPDVSGSLNDLNAAVTNANSIIATIEAKANNAADKAATTAATNAVKNVTGQLQAAQADANQTIVDLDNANKQVNKQLIDAQAVIDSNATTLAQVQEQSENIQSIATYNQEQIDKGTVATQDQINSISSSLEEKANEVDLEVQKSRIDLLIKIESGETEGNTELLDIRIGADGIEYDTAGGAIRGQFTELSKLLSDNNIFTSKFITSKYNTSTDVTNTGNDNTEFTITQVDGINHYSINALEGNTVGKAFTFTDRNTTFSEDIIITIDVNATSIDGVFARVRFKDADGNTLNHDEYFYLSDDGSNQIVIDSSSYTDAVSFDLVQLGVSSTTVAAYEFYNIQIAKKSTVGKTALIDTVNDLNSTVNSLNSNVNTLMEDKKIKANIIFCFDQTMDDRRAAILEENGFRATFSFTNADDINNLKPLVKRGHDYGIYKGIGTTPLYTGNTVSEWITFIKASITQLNSMGLYFPTEYCCAGNRGSLNILEACKKLGFKYVRCGYVLKSGETWETDADCKFLSVADNKPDTMARYVYSLNKGVDNVKAQIDNAIENGYTLELMSHTFEYDNYTEADFTTIVEYIKSKADAGLVEVLTSRQYYNKYYEKEGRELDFQRIVNSSLDSKTS